MSIPHFPTGPMGPATHVFAITPHDSNALPSPCKAIRANTAGNVVFRAIDSAADVTMAVAVGELLPPVIVTHVRATGTTASLHGFA